MEVNSCNPRRLRVDLVKVNWLRLHVHPFHSWLVHGMRLNMMRLMNKRIHLKVKVKGRMEVNVVDVEWDRWMIDP